jgi:N-acetylmuramoyl-L-alanine amidase-like protein
MRRETPGRPRNPLPGRARGRASGPPEEYLDALETVSSGVRDPVAKLRFLRTSLARRESVDQVSRVPWAPARRAVYRWLSLEGLRHVLDSGASDPAARVDYVTRASLAFGRAAVVGLGLILGIGAGAAVYRRVRPPVAPLLAAPRQVNPPAAPASDGVPPVSVASQAVAPAGIWLVEKGPQWELYSNGLRIDTGLTVKGTPRAYRVFNEDGTLDPQVQTAPVGLLFHTSESDVWPLEAAYNENLRGTSLALLRYVQKNRLYHYVIDRFGRVYRIVSEDSKANHAGNSVWADAGKVYLNLNHAFLGVSFETRWEGGKALPITQAQLAAGRNLSDALRQRYGIVPEMCVTHGLTSVNPKKRLIGHHMDWARGFPFEAFGLPDQYRRPAPSVALFGFDYDDDFLKVLDEPWPGVHAAEALLATEARRAHVDVADLRSEKQAAYDRWIEKQAGEDPDHPGSTDAGRVSERTEATADASRAPATTPERLQ